MGVVGRVQWGENQRTATDFRWWDNDDEMVGRAVMEEEMVVKRARVVVGRAVDLPRGGDGCQNIETRVGYTIVSIV